MLRQALNWLQQRVRTAWAGAIERAE
jgi:hypothetical protein